MDQSALKFFQTKTVLIAEDDKATLETLRSVLKHFFKEIIVAIDGKECFGKFEDFHPDILITDIEMPNLNGLHMIEKIRQKDFTTPIIIISAYDKVEYLLKASNLDIQGYILKPLDIDDLTATFIKIYSHMDLPILIAPELYYSYTNAKLFFQNENIPLGHKENEFLKTLVTNKGKTVSYEVIEYSIWGKEDETMTLESLRTLVKKLRHKIPLDIIENISKSGYRLKI